MKTLKQFEKSQKSFDEFLKPMDRIDEELYEHITCAYVAPNYTDQKCAQNGECTKSENGIDYYETVITVDGKYYYLGLMPSFEPTVYYRPEAEDYRYDSY